MSTPVVAPLLCLLILGCTAGKALDADQDGYATGDDCDDANAAVSPQAPERCDGIDNNCDGEIDGTSAEDQVPLYADTDADGYGDAATSTVACPGQPGWVDDATDCNDGEAGIFPGAEERCNGVDDNCDGTVDEATATDATEWFLDDDGDAFGDPSQGLTACEAPPGYEATSGDCDDQAREVYPGAPERCDGRDNNCDGQTDEPAAIDAVSWYPDGDGDGFGAGTGAVVACEAPPGFSAADADCDDADPAIFPSAVELCNGLDDDCDGAIDPASSVDAQTWYADGDGDGFGDASTTALSCDQPPGYTADSADCDDRTATSFPGADEWCNGADDNCDGQVDGDSALDTSVWYADADADGFGDAQSSRPACTAPSGWVADATDCDDGLATVFPGADEWCNGLDDNCDGQVDEDSALDATVWYTDADADGVGDATSGSPHCEAPAGSTALGTDCDDADASAYPGAPEACDGVDHNCDGVTATGSSVPTDYATISLAIAAATDGDTICVEAGSYAEALDFGGKTLQLVGAGSAFTFLDVSSGPIRSAAGSLSGLTIHSGTGAAGSGSGGGLICAGSTLSLDDLLFSDHQCSETYCYGTVISATECDLSWNKVRFENNSASGTFVRGTLLYADRSTLSATDLSATSTTVTGGVDYGALFFLRDGDLSVDQWTVTDTAVSTTRTLYGGIVWLYSGSAATVNHASFQGNTIEAPSDSLYGGLICGADNNLELQWIDVRDNDIQAGVLYGGLFYTSSGAEQSLSQLIVAGNRLGGSTALRGGVTLADETAGSYALTSIQFADIYGNSLSGTVYGGVAYGYYAAATHTSAQVSGNHTFDQVTVSGNSSSGTTYGSVYYSNSAHSTSTFRYSNFYDNSGADFHNRSDPTGSDGNISVAPDYTDISSIDPIDWDLSPTQTSPLRDAGDPTLSDADGSRCDISAYGGSDGGGW